MLLLMQKVGQVLPELVAGGTREGRGFKISIEKIISLRLLEAIGIVFVELGRAFKLSFLISVAVCSVEFCLFPLNI